MVSFKDLLQRTMLFTAASDAGTDAFEKLQQPAGAPLAFPPATPSPTSKPETRPIWSFEHDPGAPARLVNVQAFVTAHGMTMPVFDKVEVEKASVTLVEGQAAVDLPLTPSFLLTKFQLRSGRIKARDKGWWQLEANVDASILMVFAYELAAGGPKPLKLGDVVKLGDKFFPAPDIDDKDDPDRVGSDPSAPGSSPTVEVGQKVTAYVAPPWVIVAFGLTTCMERTDFEPGGVLGAGRVYPHVMVTCNRKIVRAETSIVLQRPSKVMAHSDEALTEIKPLFVADTNAQRSTAPLPIPVWSNFFDYYDTSPELGKELKFVDPTKTEPRPVKDGILREALIRTKTNVYASATEFTKTARQGEFDNIHLAPRMKFENKKTGVTISEIAMAPFCEHDCLHTHMRWGRASASVLVPSSNNGFEGRRPYRTLTAPLVPGDQAVYITPLSPSSIRYRAAAGGPFYAGAWTVFNHHGSAYSLSISAPTKFSLARFGVAQVATGLGEPFTRPLVDFIVVDTVRVITDVHPTASVAALYQRLQFTGTADPDVWLPRIKILDLDLCRRT